MQPYVPLGRGDIDILETGRPRMIYVDALRTYTGLWEKQDMAVRTRDKDP